MKTIGVKFNYQIRLTCRYSTRISSYNSNLPEHSMGMLMTKISGTVMVETISASLMAVRVAKLNLATMRLCLDGSALTLKTVISTSAKIAFAGSFIAKKKICLYLLLELKHPKNQSSLARVFMSKTNFTMKTALTAQITSVAIDCF
jgi:hypothetical protein